MPRLEQLEQSNVQHGTNCTMVFQSNDGSFTVAVRVRKLAYKWEVIATESHARESRAMYPRQRAVGQFALTLELKGYNEFHQLMDFMRSYVYSWRYGSKPTMLVTMAVRDFSRRCVPIKGMSIGDHVGSMVFLPTIIFESAHDPLDPTILNIAQASSYDLAGTENDVKNFFYPFSRASQDTNVRPETIYDFGETDRVTQVMPTPGKAPNSSIEDTLDAIGRNSGR
jgi:hypothetical protein